MDCHETGHDIAASLFEKAADYIEGIEARRDRAGARPRAGGMTTLQAIEVIRDSAERFHLQASLPIPERCEEIALQLEKAAERLECIADNVADCEADRDDLSRRLANAEARLQALEDPLNTLADAARILAFATCLDEPVPAIEVRR